jgi:hypothetical protein
MNILCSDEYLVAHRNASRPLYEVSVVWHIQRRVLYLMRLAALLAFFGHARHFAFVMNLT